MDRSLEPQHRRNCPKCSMPNDSANAVVCWRCKASLEFVPRESAKRMPPRDLQFQSSRRFDARAGFPGAVDKTLEQFTAQAPGNLRRGQATVITTVTNPEDNTYFAIVLAGPFQNMEALRECLRQIPDGEMLEHLRRIGLEDAGKGGNS